VDIDVLWLLAALGGGAFAAAIGGLMAFAFTGFTYLYGLALFMNGGESVVIDMVAFGPYFGPHIAFAGAVAASAYAKRRGYIEDGKDIATPLAGLGKPDVLAVGAVFGGIGYLINQALEAVPWLGSEAYETPSASGTAVFSGTDTVALTVVISAILVRLIIARSSPLGPFPKDVGIMSDADSQWVPHQSKWGVAIAIGAFVGILVAGVALTLFDVAGAHIEDPGTVYLVGFGISAASLTLLVLGLSVPVTHHMTLLAGLSSIVFLDIVDGNMVLAALIGVVFAVIGAILGEFWARLFHNRGNTHIDPPAFAIFTGHILIMALAGVIGG